jgi:protein-S-isoprenylcysteine O-methyltransferase Ste14
MNHGNEAPAYGLWPLVVINSAVFLLFAFSFFKPKTKRDWRTFGGFSGFIIALFAEMYGFPLTIYLLSGWLTRRFPGADLFSHDMGHLWYDLLGFKGDPHTNPIHIASNVFIIAGFFLLSASWKVLFAAQKGRTLAATGPYAYVRHPQYIGFIVIMLGFLLQWPTLVTLVMFPILAATYVRLAHREEREVASEFGSAWTTYAEHTPRWIPNVGGRPGQGSRHAGGTTGGS